MSRDVLINNSLADLYGKCGAVELARQVLDRMPERDLASGNAMILALASHGRVQGSLDLFDLMTRVESVVPNAITFAAVLSACNHGGLVDEGRRYLAAAMVTVSTGSGQGWSSTGAWSTSLLEEPARCVLQEECWAGAQ